jgi:hypothetical protein
MNNKTGMMNVDFLSDAILLIIIFSQFEFIDG